MSVHRKKTLEGLERAARLGRYPGRPLTVSDEAIRKAIRLGTIAGARKVGLCKAQFIVRRKRLEEAYLATGEDLKIRNVRGLR